MLSFSFTRSFRRTSIAAAVATFCALPASASLNSDAQSLFDSMGAVGNVTAPQAFKGQTMYTYSAGSVFLRAPQRTYQLAAVQLPYVRGGCGGIDLYGGSFSHISGQQFKQMLQNMTSALPGVLFQLALKSVEPLLGGTIEWLQSIADMVNRANVNSCEAAKGMVAWGADQLGFTTQKACQRVAGVLPDGIVGDEEEARLKCQSAEGVNDVLGRARDHDETKELVPFQGNIVWAALKKMPHLSDEDRELVMSITGTTVYPQSSSDALEPQPFAPTITSLTTLLRGNAAPDSAPAAGGNITIQMLSCGADTSECLHPVQRNTTMVSITQRVADLMFALSAKIRARDQAPTVAEVTFVNIVPLPVYRLLASSNAINSANIDAAKIGQYQDYVAIEFAYALLVSSVNHALAGSAFTARLIPIQRDQMALHTARARDLMHHLDSARQLAAVKAQSFVAIAADIEQMERNLRSVHSQQVADLLSYSGVGG